MLVAVIRGQASPVAPRCSNHRYDVRLSSVDEAAAGDICFLLKQLCLSQERARRNARAWPCWQRRPRAQMRCLGGEKHTLANKRTRPSNHYKVKFHANETSAPPVEGNVIVMQGPMIGGEFLTYRADYTAVAAGTRLAFAFQWDPSPVSVSFYARADSPGTELELSVILRDESDAEEQIESATKILGTAYGLQVWNLPITTFEVHDIEIRIWVEDAAEVRLDHLRITDDLEWLSQGDPAPVYARTDEGYLTKDGLPHFPRILWWGNTKWRDPTELDDAFSVLAGRGFSGVFAPPRQSNHSAYSRRGLRVFLDTAELFGLEVVVSLPVYPCCYIADWAKSEVLVKDLVSTLSDHPALFGWLLRDEVTFHQITELADAYDVRDWVREAEGDPQRFHPVLGFTSEGPFLDPLTWSGNPEPPWVPCASAYDCLEHFHGDVDAIVPNMLPIQNNQSKANPRRRYSISTELAKASQMQARLSQPGDAPMIMPSIQVEPAHCNTRSPSPADVSGMIAQAALGGASGVMFWKGYWDLSYDEAVNPGNPEHGPVLAGYPEDGCVEGDDPEYREFRLLVSNSRQLWEDRDLQYGLPGGQPGGSQTLWQQLPFILSKATEVFETIYAKNTGDGFDRELVYDPRAGVGIAAEVFDGYIKQSGPETPHGLSSVMDVGGRSTGVRSMIRFDSNSLNASFGTDCDTKVHRAVLRTLLLDNDSVAHLSADEDPSPPDEGENVALNLLAAQLPEGYNYWLEDDTRWDWVSAWLDEDDMGLLDWDKIVSTERMEKRQVGEMIFDHVYLEFDITDLFCRWASSSDPNSGLFIQPDFRRQADAFYAMLGTRDWPQPQHAYVSPHIEVHSYPAGQSGAQVESFEVAADFSHEVGADLHVYRDWDSEDRNEAWLTVTNPSSSDKCLQVYSGQVDTGYRVQGYDLWTDDPRPPDAPWEVAKNCTEFDEDSCECISGDDLHCGEPDPYECWYYFATKIEPWETRLFKVYKP